jgi:hypothetical protein
MVHGVGREPGPQPVLVHAVEIRRLELVQADRTERRLDLLLCKPPVLAQRRRCSADGFEMRDPSIDEHGQLGGGPFEPAGVDVGDELGQLALGRALRSLERPTDHARAPGDGIPARVHAQAPHPRSALGQVASHGK